MMDDTSGAGAVLEDSGIGMTSGAPRQATVPAFSYPSSEQQLAELAEAFFREGCVVVSGVLSSAETAMLRAKTDEYAANPDTPKKHISYAGTTLVLRRCHEMDPVFEALTMSEPIRKIAEAVLGPEPRFNAMNVIRNEKGQAISRWHVDDVVEFPLPPPIPRFDPRMRMPVFWMTIQIALTDIDSSSMAQRNLCLPATTRAVYPRATTPHSKVLARWRSCVKQGIFI